MTTSDHLCRSPCRRELLGSIWTCRRCLHPAVAQVVGNKLVVIILVITTWTKEVAVAVPRIFSHWRIRDPPGRTTTAMLRTALDDRRWCVEQVTRFSGSHSWLVRRRSSTSNVRMSYPRPASPETIHCHWLTRYRSAPISITTIRCLRVCRSSGARSP